MVTGRCRFENTPGWHDQSPHQGVLRENPQRSRKFHDPSKGRSGADRVAPPAVACVSGEAGTAAVAPAFSFRRFMRMEGDEMSMQDRTPGPDGRDRVVMETNEARQAETGHNVRYMLAFGLIGVIVVFCLVGLLVGGLV